MVLQRVVWIFRTFKLMNFGGAIFKNTPSSLWVFWLVEKFWAVYRIWPLSLRLGISTRQGMLFLKNGPTLAIFLFIFVLFKHNFYKKTVGCCGIRIGSSALKASTLTTWPPPRPKVRNVHLPMDDCLQRQFTDPRTRLSTRDFFMTS